MDQHMQTEDDILLAKVDADLADLIPRFLVNRQNDVEAIDRAIQISDYESLQRIGHILKGVAGSYGFIGLGRFGFEIELAAQKKDLSTLQRNYEALVDYLKKVQIVYV